jgi:hypothetical protein
MDHDSTVQKDDSREHAIKGDGVSWREVDGEIVVLEIGRASYIQLNRSAALLWRSLSSGATAASLADDLVTAFGVDIQTANADVAEFLKMCRAHDLLAD